MTPLIAVPGRRSEKAQGVRTPAVAAGRTYLDALRRAGGEGAVLLPGASASAGLADLLPRFDGLLLLGGGDVDPATFGALTCHEAVYGVEPDHDAFELAAVRAALALDLPVLAVCRGLQVLNVAFGGTLLQDIATLQPGALTHRDAGLYDQNFHDVAFVPGTRLAQLYPGVTQVRTNSVHHQGINRLAEGFVVEARCPDDQMIEAVRWQGPSFVAAVQWHPEFHDPADRSVIDDGPILQDFLDAARAAHRS